MGNLFHSKRFLVLLVILWTVSLAVVLLFWLHGKGHFLFLDRFNQQYSIPVQDAKPSGHGPYSYSVPVGMKRFSQNDNFQSPARLYEEGRSLGPGNAPHADIGALGGGRFSFWENGTLYFSASDNTDPRTSGRKYVLELPLSLSPVEMVIALIWLGFLTLGLLITGRRILLFVFDVLIHLPFHSKRFLVLLAILWTVSLAVMLLFWLHIKGFFPYLDRFNQQYSIPVQDAKPSGHGPYSYSAPVGTKLLSRTNYFLSPAKLYEDGRALGPGNAPHTDIGTLGGGRFSFYKNGTLYFSSSDNSDPRTNGQQYTLVLPNYTVFAWSLVIFLIISLIFGFRFGRDFRAMPGLAQNRSLLYISIIIVSIAFIITRLPWFVDYPVPLIFPDTQTYFDPARQIFSGHWPIFDMRTPGYPLFLALSLTIFPYLKFTVILQNLLTFCSALFFVWATYKMYGKLVVCAGITMVAHVAQPFIVQSDFSMLTESLYSSCLVLSIGLLVLAIGTQKARYALLFSLVGGYIFWVRPNGIFLFGILLIIILYMIVNSYSLKNVLCLALPMPIMLTLLLSYNYFSFGSFTLSNISDLTLYGITSVYWEPDASFPVEVNKGILQFRDEISESDQHVLGTSWDPVKLEPLFSNNAGKAVFLFEDAARNPDLPLSENARGELMTQVALKAIRSHLDMYIKLVWSNLYYFLIDESSWNVSLYWDTQKFIPQMYGEEGLAQDEFISREYFTIPSIPAISVLGGKGENLQVEIIPTPLLGIYTQFNNILKKVFDTKALLIGYFIVVLISLYLAIRSKLRVQGVFILFAVSSILLLAGVTMALITPISDRYASPTRFIEVFSIAFIPLLWTKIKVGKIK